MSIGEQKDIQKLAKSLAIFAKKQLGFKQEISAIVFKKDKKNAKNSLGKTASYDIKSHKITVYTEGRHTKDILRSISHEIVHHYQNCSGRFDNLNEIKEGYAQNNKLLREAEREAYEKGNMIFRDWEDEFKNSKVLSESVKKKKKLELDFTEKIEKVRNQSMNELFKNLMTKEFLKIETTPQEEED